MSAVLSPLGTLNTLPRELRDEIYSLVVTRDYLFLSDQERRRYGLGPKKWSGDFAIFECSTSLHQKALAILSAQCNFGFGDSASHTFQHERSEIPFVDHISQITLLFNVDIRDDPEEHDNTLSENTAGPISFFTGTDIRPLLLESPFFRAVSRLDGFNSVTLIFLSDQRIWQAHDPDGYAHFGILVDRVESALEPTLGASSSKEFEKLDPGWYPGFRGQFTFHPQEHLAKQRVQEESNSRGGGAALALSKLTINDDSEG